jgi:DNA-binding beta-propeller fold protein YncE
MSAIDGMVSTYAGTHVAGFKDGLAAEAKFNYPAGLALDNSGNLFVADEFNHVIRKITPEGIVSTFTGLPKGIGNVDGTLSTSTFFFPFGLMFDRAGSLFVAELGNNKIRKISSDGNVITYAGSGFTQPSGFGGWFDGPGDQARFNWPTGLIEDKDGNILVADQQNCKIRKIVAN